MNLRTAYIITLLLFCLHSWLTASATVNWHELPLDQAIELGKQKGKPIFIDTYALWCIPCKKMDKIFNEPEVTAYLNNHFVPIKANVDRWYGEAYQKEYQIVFLPTFIFLDKNGNMMLKVDRLLTKKELLAYLQNIVNPKPIQKKQEINQLPTLHYQPQVVNQSPQINEVDDKSGIAAEEVQVQEVVVEQESKMILPEITKIDSDNPMPTDSDVVSEDENRNLIEENADSSMPEDYGIELEEGEKLLQVMDDGTVPPDYYYDEAYTKLQEGDDTCWDSAQKYLNTQSDWSTHKNMRFICDFVRSTQSKEFQYLVENKSAFIEAFGEERINRNIIYTVYMRLHNGFPSPELDEAILLYSLCDDPNPKASAYKYVIKRKVDSGNDEDILKYLDEGFQEIGENDDKLLNLYAYYIEKQSNSKKKELEIALERIDKAIALNLQNAEYYLTKCGIHMHLRQRELATQALSSATNLMSSNDEELIERKEELILRLEELN